MKRRWMALPWLAALALVLWIAARGFFAATPPTAKTLPASAQDVSCKLTVPLQVEIVPSPTGQTDHWSVRMQSLGGDQDVVLRLGSGTEESQQPVRWQGRLTAGQEQTLDLAYTPPAGTVSVWAVLEVSGLDGAIMRAMAQTARPGAATNQITSEQGPPVVRDPDTGEEVIQFTGHVEGGQ